MSKPALSPSLARNPRLGQWLRLRRDGVVEVRSGKVELGQGVLTALAQIVAEELDVDLSRIHMEPACTGWSPDEGITSGSLSIQHSGAALRQACREARSIYLAAAARELGVDASTLRVRDGQIHSGHRSTSYASLADDRHLDCDATGAQTPQTPPSHECVGTPAPRLDLPDKVMGRPRFIQDLLPPHVLHGRVLRPPSPGARLESLDDAKARALPGVVTVLRDGSFIAVAAEREEVAVAAVERLRAGARWQESATLPDETRIAEWLRAQPHETTPVTSRVPDGVAPAPARTLEASFSRPFIAHASLAPSCALARWDGECMRVWSHTQGIFNLRADLAIALALPPEAIVVEHREGAGCYGHNGADDVALDAALLARAMPGRPVRVSWSREDELAWAPFGPAMAVDVAVDLDAAGEVQAWRTEVWSNGHSLRPGRSATPTLLAATHRADAAPPIVAINMPLAAGGGSDRNATPAYDFPACEVVNHRVLSMPLRASALRSLGAFANVFAIESLVDDIAHARSEDPVTWRLRHLADPRARTVIEAVAARAPWAGWRPREGFGRGFGFARYKGDGAYCAVAVEVELSHAVRVTRLTIAADVGLAVNPDGVANQLEGGAIQAASWTLKEAVRFDRTRVTSDRWDSYPILRFSEVPVVDSIVLQQPQLPPLGAGEAAMGPTAGAIANASSMP